MRGRRLKVLMIIAAMALIVCGMWLVQNLRERHKAAEREAYYQTVLAKYRRHSDFSVRKTCPGRSKGNLRDGHAWAVYGHGLEEVVVAGCAAHFLH